MKLNDAQCQELFAELPLSKKQWIIAIATELGSAEIKHPVWPEDQIHGAAIVGEEAGELLQAALKFRYEKGRYYQMHREAVQVGATALRFLTNTPELQFFDEDVV